MEYKLIGDHAEDTAEGTVIAPGETTAGLSFDPKDPHNKRLIDEGKLISIEKAKKEGESK